MSALWKFFSPHFPQLISADIDRHSVPNRIKFKNFFHNMLKMIYSFSKTIPRSSKSTTFTAAPIGRSPGFCIFAKNPEILKS